MSSSIVVCPLSRLSATLAESGAESVVTLLARGMSATLPDLGPARHLTLDISDIAQPQAGHVMPGEADIRRLLAFAASWDRRAPLLIHCYAGVSRSTAAAYAVNCALNPVIGEDDLASQLRAASPTATPNMRLVALADTALGRGGRMLAAIRGIGRGENCFEGNVFRLELPT